MIARAAVGIGNIDVDYATEKGILVINTPGKNTNSAAELTFGLLLSVVRNIVPAHQTMQQQGWDRHRFTGTELLDKTLGIIGLGHVGHRVARFANAFGMNVIAYDPYIADEVFERHTVKKVSWQMLIQQADVITVHTPKNKETSGIIHEKTIAEMKDGVILINAARGGIIDETALLQALESGKISGAGIDTWEPEPPVNNLFRALPQVVMTPHIGASTLEAQIRIGQSISSQVPRALRGEVVDTPVNMPQIHVFVSDVTKSYAVLAERLGRFSAQYIDFFPNHLELCYRGALSKQENTLLRLAFLKGFLESKYDQVSYVNVEQRAAKVGLRIEESNDPGFADYESALKCVLSCGEQQFKIGGVVFGLLHRRITLVNGFVFEIEPQGTILATINHDIPGMIGVIGTTLGKYAINIKQFESSRNVRGGEAMSLICVDDLVPDESLDELRSQPHIHLVRKIVI